MNEKTKTTETLESRDLTIEDQLAIQAQINYYFISLPMDDEQTFVVIRPHISACIVKSRNWLTFSKALLYRSNNEVQKYKSMERSLGQMEQLIDQFREQKTPAIEKLDYTFATCYPMNWGMK